jgi:hypothetical protein
MKLKTALFTVLLGVVLLLSGCGNKQIFDTTYTFNRAIIELPNGDIIEGKVDSWRDYEDGDQIQVVIEGKTYLVHSSKIALIKD